MSDTYRSSKIKVIYQRKEQETSAHLCLWFLSSLKLIDLFKLIVL